MNPFLRATVLGLAMICCGLPSRARDFDDELARHPAMTPVECAKQSPDEMHGRLEAESNQLAHKNPRRVSGFYFSEGGTDSFYLVYAHQLGLETDEKFPTLQRFRAPLLESFALAMEYLAEVHGRTSVRHEHDRVAARVEWILYAGASHDFKFVNPSDRWSDADYRPELIEQIGLAIGLANLNPKVAPFDAEMRPVLKNSLRSLSKAEIYMTVPQQRFFRRQLALFLTHYL